MAKADYRLCDVCEEKTFYDSNLSYERHNEEWAKDKPAYRVAGEDQGPYGLRLGWLGDWAVICSDCAKTHKCVIVPVASAPAEKAHKEEPLTLDERFAEFAKRDMP